MDENTRFLMEWMAGEFKELRGHVSAVMAEHKAEDAKIHEGFAKRMQRVEEAYLKVFGGVVALGLVADYIKKKIGG